MNPHPNAFLENRVTRRLKMASSATTVFMRHVALHAAMQKSIAHGYLYFQPLPKIMESETPPDFRAWKYECPKLRDVITLFRPIEDRKRPENPWCRHGEMRQYRTRPNAQRPHAINSEEE